MNSQVIPPNFLSGVSAVGTSAAMVAARSVLVVVVLSIAALVAAMLVIGWRAVRKRRVARRLTGLGDAVPPRRPREIGPVMAVPAGVAVALLVGGWRGVPVGVCVGLGVHRMLRRMESATARADRLQAIADLPLAADLLAAALRAGAPVDRAASAVADALGGPLGERLGRAARSLRLGGVPAEAWAHLSGVAGAERLVAAAVRSSASGGALAGALGRLADDLRADRAAAVEATARRAGVLIVLPLGLCFLPAFVLAGLVPVVVAVLGDVL